MRKTEKSFCIRFLLLLLSFILVFELLPQASTSQAAAKNSSINLTYTFEAPSIKSSSLGASVEISGLTALNEAGMPELPALPVSVLLPAGRTVDSVSVTPGKLTTVSNVLIAPAMPNIPVSEKESVTRYFNSSVYAEGESYPSGMVAKGVVSQTRGFNVYSTMLYPAIYEDGSLTYTDSIQLSIKLKDSKDTSGYQPTEEDQSFLSWKIDNLSVLSSYFEDTNTGLSKSSEILGDKSLQYVIITNEEMKSAFNVLAAYRQSGGLSASVITTEEIYKTYSGMDNAQKIRNCIVDLYKNNGIKYVLLGGDADGYQPIIPAREFYCEYENSDEEYVEFIASDIYYSNLSGSFDNDKDGIYGEATDGENGGDVDLSFDIYLGRAPVDNVTEANNFVYKTINYERSAKTGNAMMAGEILATNTVCAAEYVLSLDNGSVKPQTIADNMRRLRDNFMSKEAVGLYYNAKDYVVEVLALNPALALRLAKLAYGCEQALKVYVSGGTLSPLTDQQAKELRVAFTDLASAFRNCKVDSDCRDALIKVCDEYSGLLADAKGKTLGDIFEASTAYSNSGTDYDKLDTVYGGDYKDQIIYGHSDDNFETVGIADTYSVSTLYDRDGEWSDSQMLDKLNSDSLDVINHLGHANTSTMMKLSIAQVRKLTNSKLFFIYSQGCYAGSFDNKRDTGTFAKSDSIAEELLLSSKKSGAYALIVNSRYGWYSTEIDKSPSNLYDRMFWSKMVQSDNKQIGYLLAVSKEEFIPYVPDNDIARYCYYEITLLGDPLVTLGNVQSSVVSVPANLSASVPASLDYAKLKWSGVPGALKYIVYRSTSSSGTYSKVASVTDTSWSDSKPSAGKTYYYRVSAVGKSASSAKSPAIKVMMTLSAPQLTIASNSATSIKLKWGTVAGSKKYIIYRSTSKSGKYVKVGETTKTSYVDSGLKNDKTYYYKVKATSGKSSTDATSAAKSAKAALTAPVVTLSNSTNTAISVSWTQSPGANGYKVYRATSKNGTYKLVTTVGKTLKYTNKKLTMGKTYYYKVKAIYKSGKKSYSSSYSAIMSIKVGPKYPASFKAAKASTNGVALTWSANSSASGYVIYYSTSVAGEYKWLTKISKNSTVSYTHKNLDTDTVYFYKIRSYVSTSSGDVYGAPSGIKKVVL